ncbi:uncharacterized protein A4U43_C08F34220 [Asparagus officinalis]|nr:uncharacterized protein A4U43_C08F34220 [Asparagus officinalis]
MYVDHALTEVREFEEDAAGDDSNVNGGEGRGSHSVLLKRTVAMAAAAARQRSPYRKTVSELWVSSTL